MQILRGLNNKMQWCINENILHKPLVTYRYLSIYVHTALIPAPLKPVRPSI